MILCLIDVARGCEPLGDGSDSRLAVTRGEIKEEFPWEKYDEAALRFLPAGSAIHPEPGRMMPTIARRRGPTPTAPHTESGSNSEWHQRDPEQENDAPSESARALFRHATDILQEHFKTHKDPARAIQHILSYSDFAVAWKEVREKPKASTGAYLQIGCVVEAFRSLAKRKNSPWGSSSFRHVDKLFSGGGYHRVQLMAHGAAAILTGKEHAATIHETMGATATTPTNWCELLTGERKLGDVFGSSNGHQSTAAGSTGTQSVYEY